MALSRADFVGIADTFGLLIRRTDSLHDQGVIRGVAVALCIDLKASNRNFDKDRFIAHIDEVADGERPVTS